MSRQARLASAKHWLTKFREKNVVRGYARWFAVDHLCAVKELRMLGVEVAEAYEEQLVLTMQNRARQRRAQREARERRLREEAELDAVCESDDVFAYIAGYTNGGAPFGITWEEWDQLEGDHHRTPEHAPADVPPRKSPPPADPQ